MLARSSPLAFSSASTAASRRPQRGAVVCQAAAGWRQRAAAAALTTSLLLSPVASQPAAAAPKLLADLLRDDYSFVDANKDGTVTRDELQQFVGAVSQQENLPLVNEDALDFAMKLYDLNQDGKLKSEEVLRSLVLDGAVDDEAVDTDVFDCFDRNGNKTIEREEFTSTLGDLGPNGEAATQFVFDRVDRLSGGEGHLSVPSFANALVLVRTMVLGY